MIVLDLSILNQKGTPMFNSDIFTNRPAFGIVGRIFISTDTAAIYRDTGTAWDLIADGGSSSTNIYNSNGTLSANRVVSDGGFGLSFTPTTHIGTAAIGGGGSGKLIVGSSTADNGIQIFGANSPSLRIDNAQSGGTQRFIIGLATSTNNFIQGAIASDFCITTASSGAILFGMWQSINASEVMRISTASNLIVGSTTDNGNRFQVTGAATISSSVTAASFNGTTNNIFSVSGSEKMRLDSSGNLSIGNTSALSKLEVTRQGNNLGGTMMLSGSKTDSASKYGYITTLQYASSAEPEGVCLIGGTNLATDNIISIGGDLGELNAATHIKFWTASNTSTRGGTQAMQVAPTQNVQIGTTIDSGQKLIVAGTGFFSDSGSTLLTLNSTFSTGYTAIQINSSGVAKGLIGFGSFLTTDAGFAIRTASGVPFTVAVGGGTPNLTIATTGAATFNSSIAIGNSVAAAVAAPSTHKVAILIGGVQYYLLASNV